jgi:hypothetical protein
MKWAIIEDNRVSNIIIWDGTGEIFSGKTMIQLNEGEWCNIGSLYDANANPRFIEQEQPE